MMAILQLQKEGRMSSTVCYKCNRTGHFARECSQGGSSGGGLGGFGGSFRGRGGPRGGGSSGGGVFGRGGEFTPLFVHRIRAPYSYIDHNQLTG